MLIALLAVLGVDLIFLAGLLGVAIARKRWVVRQPGVFRGLVRVASGEIDGFRPFGVTGTTGSVPGKQDAPPSRGIKVGGPDE